MYGQGQMKGAEMSAKVCDFVAYRAAHPGSAVRVQVHYAPLWPLQFWVAFWREVMGLQQLTEAG